MKKGTERRVIKMTKFIGYKRKHGKFTDKETGELVNYDNYDLYFITCDVPDIVGYYPSSYRLKKDTIRKVLRASLTADDDYILGILGDLINKEVMISVLNVDDKPVLSGLMLVDSDN